MPEPELILMKKMAGLPEFVPKPLFFQAPAALNLSQKDCLLA